MFRQEHLSVSALSDLGQHLEITLPQSGTALPQCDALTPGETCPGGLKFFRTETLVRFLPILGTAAASVNVGDEVVVVVVKICVDN